MKESRKQIIERMIDVNHANSEYPCKRDDVARIINSLVEFLPINESEKMISEFVKNFPSV